jgi:hypothetical protein
MSPCLQRFAECLLGLIDNAVFIVFQVVSKFLWKEACHAAVNMPGEIDNGMAVSGVGGEASLLQNDQN